MNRFAELLDSLIFTPSRNSKLRLIRDYFSTTPDPERGWALAVVLTNPAGVLPVVYLAFFQREAHHPGAES